MCGCRYRSMKCRRLLLCSCLLLTCLSQGNGKKQKKLQIITKSKPDDCTLLAESGDTVTVHYTGKLQNGQVFDSSRRAGQAFTVQLGAGQVIKGWDEGLIGMCVGEERKLIVPPHLGYGDGGVQGAIPGGATLEFEIELLDLSKKPYSILPQGSGFFTVLCIFGVLLVSVYELYKRANKQGVELKESKKKLKEKEKRGKVKNPKKNN